MQLPLIEILYAALNSEIGVVVRTTQPDRLRQKLYAEKRKDEALKNISINASRTDPENELWIIKKPNIKEISNGEG